MMTACSIYFIDLVSDSVLYFIRNNKGRNMSSELSENVLPWFRQIIRHLIWAFTDKCKDYMHGPLHFTVNSDNLRSNYYQIGDTDDKPTLRPTNTVTINIDIISDISNSMTSVPSEECIADTPDNEELNGTYTSGKHMKNVQGQYS